MPMGESSTNVNSNTGFMVIGTAYVNMPGSQPPPSPPNSRPNGPSENPETTELEVVNKVSDFLRNDYLDKYDKINRNPLKTAQTQIRKVFVKPVLKSVDESGHSSQGDGGDLMYRIFEGNNGSRLPRRILICGQPSMGKTMLCQKYVYDWADVDCVTREPFDRFKIVILLKLCEVQGKKTWKEILEQEVFCNRLTEDEKAKFFSYMKTHPGEFLFLFDGVDDCSLDQLPDVKNILSGKDVTGVYLIATARPEPSNRFLMFSNDFHSRYCISGYNENTVKEFVSNFFGQTETKCEGVLEQLESYNDLMEVAKIPLVGLVMCELMKDGQNMSLTLTKLLDGYTDVVIQLFSLKMGQENERKERILNSHGRLALSGVMKTPKGRMLFSKDELDEMKVDPEVGFIHTEIDQRLYKFPHKKIQEYFAAKWIVENWSSKNAHDSLNKMMNDSEFPLYSSVLVFIAGLLANKKDLLDKFLDDFFETVKEFLEQSCYCKKMDLLFAILAETWKEEDSEKILKLVQGIEPFKKTKAPNAFPLDMSYRAAQGLALIVRKIQTTRLDLSGIMISNDVAKVIAVKCLKKNCKLKSVKFNHSYLYPDGIKVVCDAFKSMVSLEEIDLTACNFANEGLLAIADLLVNGNHGITSLQLGNHLHRPVEKEQNESQERTFSRQESVTKMANLTNFEDECQKSPPGDQAIAALINAIMDEESDLKDISLPSSCVGNHANKLLDALGQKQLKRIKLHLKKLDKKPQDELVKLVNNKPELEISVVLEDEKLNRSEYEKYSLLSSITKGKIKLTIKDHTHSVKGLPAS